MVWVERVAPNWEHWDVTGWILQPMPETLTAPFEEEQEAFDVRLLEDVLADAGEDGDLLAQLGHLYTQVGRYRDGLAVDLRLVALKPRDATAHYNLACSYSLLNRTSAAIAALRKAVELGYRDVDYMREDPDLENLRADPRWDDLLGVLNP